MKNYLIGIGIDSYKSVKHLSNAVRDTKVICDILSSKYGFDNPRYLLDDDATNEKIHEIFSTIHEQITEDDNLLIYYAGHGDIDDKMGIGYWIPYDAQYDKKTTYFPNSTLIDFVKRLKAKHIVIISDSCFSRSILLDADNITRSLYDYEKQKSRWAITSGRKPVPDGMKGGHSPFAESIIKYLNEQKNDFIVSDLIQQVKKIANNSDQNPQGSPLANVGHDGGEYIFKPSSVKRIKKSIYEGEIRGYNDIPKILQSYQPQEQFSDHKSFEDKTQKIGYSLFKRENKLLKQVEYYLYLYKGINQKATELSLRSKCPEVFKSRNFIILVPREEDLKNQETRKKHIQNKFKSSSVYYIDEFIWDFCTPKSFTSKTESKLLDINNFVPPRVLNEDEKDTDFNDITNWLSAVNEQVLVLRGVGGIGKTTVAKYIADFFQIGKDKEHKQKKSLFIESSEIIDELQKAQNTEQELNIYSFYEAHSSRNNDYQDKLNDVIFKVNLDNGNLLVIIDGLDEIISKVPKFDVNLFLNSIFDLYNEIGSAKVIITCRNHFWDKSKINEDYQLKIFELLPFDEPQAKIFFNHSFNDTKKTDKCIKIAKEFISNPNSDDYIFQPYVLDVIKNIVESNGDIMIDDFSFDSKYLLKDNKSDYIIFNVCRREIKRIGQISVEEQIRIFMVLAVKYNGIIAESILSEKITSITQSINSTKFEALKSHPFISTSKTNNSMSFKYDFLIDTFKGIYLKSLFDINNTEPVIEEGINLLANNCGLNSNLTREVVGRIKSLSDNEIIKIVDIISDIQKLNINNITKVKAISGLFAIALLSNKENNIEQNTKLLTDLFETNNFIQNLCIVNFSSYENIIKFNLSDRLLKDCYIDSYRDFWSCKFNENTRFIDCKLYNLPNDKNKEITIKETQFQNCHKDATVNEVFKNYELIEKNVAFKIQDFLDSFFSIFLKNGNITALQYDSKNERGGERDDIKSKYKKITPRLFELEILIDKLKSENIIDDHIFPSPYAIGLKISNEYKMDVTKFCKEGTVSPKISKIIKLLLNN